MTALCRRCGWREADSEGVCGLCADRRERACDCFPHGPSDACTCDGCWACEGRVLGCTCDIAWDCEHDAATSGDAPQPAPNGDEVSS